MSSDEQEARKIMTMAEDTLLQFKQAIKSQEQQNLQASRRASHMMRYGLAIIILLSIGIVFLAWPQKSDMKQMNKYMERMTNDISVMSNSIVKMQTSMSTIESGINKVVYHSQAISNSINQKESLVNTLLHIAGTVELMQSDAHGLSQSMGNVNYNLSTINKQMKSLNRKLGTMVQDLNRMPSPTRMFPF